MRNLVESLVFDPSAFALQIVLLDVMDTTWFVAIEKPLELPDLNSLCLI